MAVFAKHMEIYKALGDETRLRLLYLCAQTGLSIKDLMLITKQSQPRLSRHLKLMVKAGILNRVQEGNSVYFYLNRDDCLQKLWDFILTDIAHSQITQKDGSSLKRLTKIRAAHAINSFSHKALNWEEVTNKVGRHEILDVHIKNMISQLKPNKLLDVGCGYGYLLGQIASFVKEAYGLEPDVQMINIARAHIAALGHDNVVFYKSDIKDLEQYHKKYDLIIAHFFLHLVKNVENAINHMQKALNTNGTLMIIDISKHKEIEWAKRLRHVHYGFSSDSFIKYAKGFNMELSHYQKVSGVSLDAQILLFKRKI